MTLYDLKSCFFFLCYGLLRCQMGAQKLRWLAASAAAGLFQRIFVINAIYCDTGHPWRERPQSSVTLRVLFWSICFFPLGHTVCQRGAPRGSFHHFFFHFSNVTQRIRVPFMQKKNSTLILDHCYAHFFHRARELSQVLRHCCGAFHSTTLQLLHV